VQTLRLLFLAKFAGFFGAISIKVNQLLQNLVYTNYVMEDIGRPVLNVIDARSTAPGQKESCLVDCITTHTIAHTKFSKRAILCGTSLWCTYLVRISVNKCERVIGVKKFPKICNMGVARF